MQPETVYPLSHRLLVELTPILPPGEFHVGYSTPSSTYYHPLEVPAYVRKRLLAFLHGLAAIPPAFLDGVLPTSEVNRARTLFKQLLAAGQDEGQALMTMGLLTKNRTPSAPPLSVARVIRSACACIKEDYVVVCSSSGEPIRDSIRLIRCGEALAATTARTVADTKAEEAACDARRRAAFARARSFRVA